MAMRFALAAVGLAACIVEPTTGGPPPNDTGWGSGWGGSSGTSDWGCHYDSQCGGSGNVCARDGECLSASSVRTIHVTGTMRGQLASDASCSQASQLEITFSDATGEQFGFAPVPCNAGKYPIDKFPTSYNAVDLSRIGDRADGAHGTFDGT